ncbi:MAG TPA: PAS domain-containing protein [bacterium]|nr:PAS domain-containing protein [bacterium]
MSFTVGALLPGRDNVLSQPSNPIIDSLLARQDLHGGNASLVAELRSFAGERDPELFSEALYSFARRQEGHGREALAQATFQAVAEQGGSAAPRAREQLAAYAGNGGLGARAEIFTRRLSQELSSESGLLSMAAMGAGIAAFRVTQLAALSRLTANPAARAWLGGAGSRLAAGTAGLLLEAPTFALSHHGLRAAAGLPTGNLSDELASAFLLMGSLRGTGALSQGLYRASGLRSVYGQSLAHQAGLLGGIYLAHGLEQRAGLTQESMDLAGALSRWLHFNIMGSVAQRALGPRFAAWESQLAAQRAQVSQNSRPGSGFDLGLPPLLTPALAMGPEALPSARFPGPRAYEGPARIEPVRMSMSDDAPLGGNKYPDTGLRIIREARQLAIPKNAQSAQVMRILENWMEQQSHPIIVARMNFLSSVLRANLKQVAIGVTCNRAFLERFGYTRAEIVGRPMMELFGDNSVRFIMSRISMMGLGSGEFQPSPIPWRAADGTLHTVIGAGIKHDFNGETLGIGIFTEMPGAEPTPTPTSGVAPRNISVAPARPEPLVTAIRPTAPSAPRPGGLADRVSRALRGEAIEDPSGKKGSDD